jgi:DNA-binding beta-propeller fold protein YncE
MRTTLNTRIQIAALAVPLIWLAAGCATRSTQRKDFIFFPPAPNEPRVQFLTAFGSETDLKEGTTFADFVVGEEKFQRPLWKPYGVTTTKDTVYVVDSQAANLGIIDLAKRRIRFIRPTGRDAMETPINVAVDKNGNRYVTDPKRGQVMIFDKRDQLLDRIGKQGEGRPCGIAAAGDRLYVSDLAAQCVRVYDINTRNVLLTFPLDPKEEKSRLRSPTNIAIDREGRMYVSDTGDYTMKVYDAQGKHLWTVGEQGLNPGNFALPKGVGVDREGRMYVVDAATAVVQIFDREGRLLMYFGEPKSSGPGGLYLPAALAIDYDNVALFQKHVAPGYKIEHLIFVTNQAGTQKVAVYGFLRKG